MEENLAFEKEKRAVEDVVNCVKLAAFRLVFGAKLQGYFEMSIRLSCKMTEFPLSRNIQQSRVFSSHDEPLQE